MEVDAQKMKGTDEVVNTFRPTTAEPATSANKLVP
jgi:hypothetical protein